MRNTLGRTCPGRELIFCGVLLGLGLIEISRSQAFCALFVHILKLLVISVTVGRICQHCRPS